MEPWSPPEEDEESEAWSRYHIAQGRMARRRARADHFEATSLPPMPRKDEEESDELRCEPPRILLAFGADDFLVFFFAIVGLSA